MEVDAFFLGGSVLGSGVSGSLSSVQTGFEYRQTTAFQGLELEELGALDGPTPSTRRSGRLMTNGISSFTITTHLLGRLLDPLGNDGQDMGARGTPIEKSPGRTCCRERCLPWTHPYDPVASATVYSSDRGPPLTHLFLFLSRGAGLPLHLLCCRHASFFFKSTQEH